ncbi:MULTISPECIES: PAS domain S-box protein [unclassified Ruegeria]|uniref:hybrid sensor histidine kinase/response regulator n=2 Tax=Ruegeria TaxID=97050 RepID=UPI00148992B0|nr:MULTISPECIES: PAS domain S-box protein [unclassified Ruegeria]NOD36193.1 PAS domain S-box protein [Ruegeria sp. HKCCD7296]NOE34111.1 PAS domain S-box protein [Ruegeria sp. HKCCD7318]
MVFRHSLPATATGETSERSMAAPLGVAIAMGVALVFILSVFLYMSRETTDRIGEMRKVWQGYSVETTPRGYWISEIRGYFGYGGLIHNFKNYVLRHDAEYSPTLKSQSQNLLTTIETYRNAAPSQTELDALQRIERVALEYIGNIPKIEAGIAAGLRAEEIDALVRVDDSDALAALSTLEALWITERDQSLSDMVQAFSEGEQLVRRFSVLLVGLIAVVGVIAILTTLLISNILRTNRRLKAELELREQVELAERKLARAVEQSPASIIITDTELKIEYANRKFFDLSGYEADEVYGHTPRMLQSGHSGQGVYADLRQKLQRGKSWYGVFRNLSKDGSHYWVSTAIFPLVDQNGKVTHYIGIGEDITETRRTHEQFAQVQKMEAVGILAGSVAHDFNNVLMSITGNADLIELDAEGIDDIQTSVNHIRIAARRAQALVRKMLTFARQRPRNPRRGDMVKATQEALDLIRVSAPPSVQTRFDIEVETAFSDFDGTLFFQTLLNLCHNAFEAMGDQPGEVALRIGLVDKGALDDLPDGAIGVIRLDVSDTGPGIAEDLQQQVFQPFFSTKPVGKGTGLGLTIVHNSVEECHGRVELHSEPGKGTCFSLFYPLMPALSPEDQAEVEAVAGDEHVLLVDDDENILYVTRRLLTRYGYRVEAYSDPLKAREAFREAPESYDILISDLMMPGLRGTDLIESVRAIRSDLPAILISSYFDDAEVSVAGASPIMVQKPLEIQSLARIIRSQMT